MDRGSESRLQVAENVHFLAQWSKGNISFGLSDKHRTITSNVNPVTQPPKTFSNISLYRSLVVKRCTYIGEFTTRKLYDGHGNGATINV